MSELNFNTLTLPIEPGDWRDADERMFLACFTILGQFVEEELGLSDDPECVYRGYRLHSCGGNDEKAIDLWLWYRDELPEQQRACDQDTMECFSGGLVTEPVEGGDLHRVVSFGRVREPKFPYDYIGDLKETKLRELMDLRRCLWT